MEINHRQFIGNKTHAFKIQRFDWALIPNRKSIQLCNLKTNMRITLSYFETMHLKNRLIQLSTTLKDKPSSYGSITINTCPTTKTVTIIKGTQTITIPQEFRLKIANALHDAL